MSGYQKEVNILETVNFLRRMRGLDEVDEDELGYEVDPNYKYSKATEVKPKAANPVLPRLLWQYKLKKDDLTPKLRELTEAGHNLLCPANMNRITVGMATCGRAAGAADYLNRFKSNPNLENRAFAVGVGCFGSCFAEPMAMIRKKDGSYHGYGGLDSYNYWDAVRTANDEEPKKDWFRFNEKETGFIKGSGDLTFSPVGHRNFDAFYEPQNRRVMEHCGLIDPENVGEYLAVGGYFPFIKALKTPDSGVKLVEEVKTSGLRGRGGGGFPTGIKLETAAKTEDKMKFVIANADEGDPGAYMDRTLLESDPHRVLEGLMLSAHAIGAGYAYIFTRREYPLAIEILQKAIDDLNDIGLLGENILGSGYSLSIGIIQSAGAFVCGEETSMLHIIEGLRGTPFPRPPHPAVKGLYGYPTFLSNVETYANITWIAEHSGEAFRSSGTEESTGTKILCLAGDIRRTGVVEVDFGTDCQTIVDGIGGGDKFPIKAVQIGGPSGGILPYRSFAIDYETMKRTGAMVGSGGLVVLNNHRCMVDIAHHFSEFMVKESCGQCLFCRDGLQELERLLALFTKGLGTEEDLEKIETIAEEIEGTSLCGLGKTAANPVLTTLKYFRDEYLAHIEGRCLGLTCVDLTFLRFNLDNCRQWKCHICYSFCPVKAIKRAEDKGDVYLSVDDSICTRCRICKDFCPNGAIYTVTGGGEYE